MIIRLARHGQPALEDMPKGANFEFPDSDYVLTPLGREQARLLGEHLKKCNFNGKVISSPYARTMETASIAAAVCGLAVTPDPGLQEMRFYPEPPCPGLTLEEMRASYPNIAPDAVLKHPWMVEKGPEEVQDVRDRVFPWLENLIAAPPGRGSASGGTRCFSGSDQALYDRKSRIHRVSGIQLERLSLYL